MAKQKKGTDYGALAMQGAEVTVGAGVGIYAALQVSKMMLEGNTKDGKPLDYKMADGVTTAIGVAAIAAGFMAFDEPQPAVISFGAGMAAVGGYNLIQDFSAKETETPKRLSIGNLMMRNVPYMPYRMGSAIPAGYTLYPLPTGANLQVNGAGLYAEPSGGSTQINGNKVVDFEMA